MKYFLAILGMLVAVVGSYISYCLLIGGKLSGGEFVVFTLGVIIVGIAVGLMSDISELSVAGNVIKLRQVKEEAELAIEVQKSLKNLHSNSSWHYLKGYLAVLVKPVFQKIRG